MYQVTWTNITDATTASYNISSIALTDAASYNVVVSGTCSSSLITSKNVTLTVNTTPTVTTTSQTATCTPSTVDLTADAVTKGSDPGLLYTYWTNSGATTTFTTPTTAGAGTYYILGTIPGTTCSAAIKSVTVTVSKGPSVIITDPAPVNYPSTVDISASVTANYNPNLTYTYFTDAYQKNQILSPTYTTLSAGTYYIKGTDANECYAIQPVNVYVNGTVYKSTWNNNNMGTYNNINTWTDSNSPGSQNISTSTNGSQSNPAFTFASSDGWDANQVFNGNCAVVTPSSGPTYLDQIVQPDYPVVPVGMTNSVSNYRAEVALDPCSYNGGSLYEPPCEIWLSWSYYFPKLSNCVDNAALQPGPNVSCPNGNCTNGAECVWHQYMPSPNVTNTPQLCLMLEANWGNFLVLQNWTPGNSVQGYGYYMPGNCNIYNTLNECVKAAKANSQSNGYGSIVAGKNQAGKNQWMDFVEHVIWDNTPNGSKGGSYQLWVTVNGVTNLWYNIQNLQTATPYYNGTTPKFGPYYNAWEDPTGLGMGANSIYYGTTAMEVYLGPVNMEYNVGAPVQESPIINGSNVPGYYIDQIGFSNVYPSQSEQGQDLKIPLDTLKVKSPATATKIAPIVNIYPNPTNGTFTVSNTSSDQYNIQVYSTSGNLVKDVQNCQGNTILDISGCSNGVYIIKVNGSSISYVGRLIKN